MVIIVALIVGVAIWLQNTLAIIAFGAVFVIFLSQRRGVKAELREFFMWLRYSLQPQLFRLV